MHDCDQVLAQGSQVYLVVQAGAEGGERLSSLILAAIEAAVNDGLDASNAWDVVTYMAIERSGPKDTSQDARKASQQGQRPVQG